MGRDRFGVIVQSAQNGLTTLVGGLGQLINLVKQLPHRAGATRTVKQALCAVRLPARSLVVGQAIGEVARAAMVENVGLRSYWTGHVLSGTARPPYVFPKNW